MENKVTSSKGRRLDNGRYRKSYDKELSKQKLKKFIDNGLSAYKIADEIGCSVKTVYSYINHYDLEYNDKRGIIEPNMNFGLLTTIKVVGKMKNGTNKWECKCFCGNIVIVPTSRLKNGRTKSCGCWRSRKRNHLWKGYCGISGSRVSEIRLRAKKKKIDFDLSAESLWRLWEKQDSTCPISGLKIDLDSTASLDRIDSNKGYILSNVWWVHKDINKMKMDLDLNQFLKYCKIISAHNTEIK